MLQNVQPTMYQNAVKTTNWIHQPGAVRFESNNSIRAPWLPTTWSPSHGRGLSDMDHGGQLIRHHDSWSDQ